MIKKIWTIRSRKKLFTGLSFGIAGFMLFYSLITVLVLEDRIPWSWMPWGSADQQVSRLLLLVIPVISLGFCILLHLAAKRKTLPLRHREQPSTEYELDAYQTLCIGESFLLSVLLAFVQLDRMDAAKGIPGFSPLIPILTAAAMVAFAVWTIRKIRRSLPPSRKNNTAERTGYKE